MATGSGETESAEAVSNGGDGVGVSTSSGEATSKASRKEGIWTMKKLQAGRIALVATTVGGLVYGSMLIGSAAFAVDYRTGYYECNLNRNMTISSRTVIAGSPTPVFSVGHYVPGGGPAQSWDTDGYHTSTHSIPGGTWTVSTTGTVNSAGAGCGGSVG